MQCVDQYTQSITTESSVISSIGREDRRIIFLVFAAPKKRPGACAHLGVRVCSGRGDGVDRVSTPIRTSRGRPPLAGSRLRWGAGGGGATGSSGRSSQRSLILEQAHQKGMPGGALRCIPRVAHPMKESSVAP